MRVIWKMAIVCRRRFFLGTVLLCSRGNCSVSHRDPKARTHYDVLGAARNARKSDIRAAFVSLSKKHHPDVSKASNANKHFSDINEAYNVLINPSKRYQYDMLLYNSEFTLRHTRGQSFDRYYPGGSLYEYTRNYEYHTLSAEEWNRIYNQSMRRPNHYKVIRWLIVMMVIATAVHTMRISSAHRQFQNQNDRETKRNLAIYNEVRERARNSTLEQQLERLTKAPSENSR